MVHNWSDKLYISKFVKLYGIASKKHSEIIVKPKSTFTYTGLCPAARDWGIWSKSVSTIHSILFSVNCIITPDEVNRRHYEYLQEKLQVINKLRASNGDDLIQLPTSTDDIKLAMMDPELYQAVKDPVQVFISFIKKL